MKRSAFLCLALCLSACDSPKTQTQTTQPAGTQAAEPAQTPAASSSAPAAKIGGTLRVMTHDSFAVSEGLLASFQEKYGVKVELIKGATPAQC
ncbi:hypothetical protein ACFP81_01235 [Deinococcus lacus]|uniref:Thiamine ABC transporter substrate-binding protein n=1 Tax=Deinococcus lacus TaxID=392561 RepID=A0ABW1Y8Z6_9DEIO